MFYSRIKVIVSDMKLTMCINLVFLVFLSDCQSRADAASMDSEMRVMLPYSVPEEWMFPTNEAESSDILERQTRSRRYKGASGLADRGEQ